MPLVAGGWFSVLRVGVHRGVLKLLCLSLRFQHPGTLRGFRELERNARPKVVAELEEEVEADWSVFVTVH